MRNSTDTKGGYGFGAFTGVFTPSILTIIGVVMYLRFGWMLGHVGLVSSLIIITISTLITLLTGLSISALATNMRMKGGGAYYMLSRSFGAEAGAAIGIPLALSQAVSVSFYTAGFAEALVHSGLPVVGTWDPRFIGLVTLSILAAVTTISANIALKSQFFIMAAIAFSLVSFFLGHAPSVTTLPTTATVPAALGFWTVLAVFFPAVTGILSGLGMSGDLKNPRRAIPLGTIAAVLTGYVVYMAVPIFLNCFISDAGILRTDTMIFQKCARWQFPVLLGVWAATLSSAVGGLLCAPRVMQALAQDRLLPRFFGHGYGPTNDPRISALLCFGIAIAGLWFGDINAIAPILTMFNLTTYGLLNLSAGLEESMGNPSWRPTFRVKSFFSFLGFFGCLGMMLMISPGWTFAAFASESLIFWIVKRRAFTARWGDMRTGLLMFIVRVALRHLSKRPNDERNWRPNILVLSGSPAKRRVLVGLAGAISQNRSLVTLAAVIPESVWSVSRETALRDSIRRYINRVGIEAQIRIQPGLDMWDGVYELVRAYGYGPIVPNTVLLGAPLQSESFMAFGQLMRILSSRQRNVAVVRELLAASETAEESVHPAASRRRIDIWWRGQNANGGFMLALACLIRRDDAWRDARLRLCTILEPEASVEDTRHLLESFLEDARVAAETEVVVPGDRSVVECISAGSADADMTCIGLRAPGPAESDTAYGQYFAALCEGTKGVPLTVFTLAEEKIDFRRIFRD